MALNNIPNSQQKGRTLDSRDFEAFYDFNGNIVRGVELANFQQLADAISGEGGERLLEYGEVLSLASSDSASIFSVTVPPGETYAIGSFLFSGNRIAIYEVLVNGIVIGKRRTWYSEFNASLPLVRSDYLAGETIEVRVINNDKRAGDFEATLSGVKR